MKSEEKYMMYSEYFANVLFSEIVKLRELFDMPIFISLNFSVVSAFAKIKLLHC